MKKCAPAPSARIPKRRTCILLIFTNPFTTAVSFSSEIFIPRPIQLVFSRASTLKTKGKGLVNLFTSVTFSGLLEVLVISC